VGGPAMRLEQTSLLDFLPAPVVVCDPQGVVVHVNPAFRSLFGDCEPGATSIADVFEGGSREALLQAIVANETGDGVHSFRVREQGRGFCGQASPMKAAGERVGSILLFSDEVQPSPRWRELFVEIEEPIAEAQASFEQILEQTGGRRGEQYRQAVETGIAALSRSTKYCGELRVALLGKRSGSDPGEAPVDTLSILRRARARLERDFQGAGVALELLVPAQLPHGRGDATKLETAIVHLLRHRLAATGGRHSFYLSGRCIGHGDARRLLVSVVDVPVEGTFAAENADELPIAIRKSIEAGGASVQQIVEAGVGFVTGLQIPLPATTSA